MVKTNQIINANVYIDGVNMLGRASEVDSPEIMSKMSDYKALGLIGSFELPVGFDKMEMRIKWNAFYQDVASKFINPFKKISIMVRANQETWEGGDLISQKPVVIYATCQSKGFPTGKYKQQDNVDVESKLSCTHVKMEIDGKEVLELDIMNNIFKIDGEDKMVEYRTNIGG